MANSGSTTIRLMLRERILQVLGQWRALMNGAWDIDAMAPIILSLNEISESAARFHVENASVVTRDAAAYLGFLVDTATAPNIVQRGRMANYLERLSQAAAELTELMAREALEQPSVLYVRALGHEIQGLDSALQQHGWRPRIAENVEAIAAATQGEPLVAVVVDSGLLSHLGEIVDALDQSRRPGPTPPLLVVTQAAALAEQLLSMTGSADAFMSNADAAGVVRKISDLQKSLSSTEPLRVLIVDDDRSQVLFCDTVLRRRGLSTKVAATSREALDLVQTFRPDLILIDLYMPEMDGMAFTARVREMPGTLLVPIVFISGEQDVGKRVTAINIGADEFLTKPIRPGHLIDVVVGRAKRARILRRQVLSSPAEAPTGPLARSVLALRIRDLNDRPAALLSVGLDQSDTLAPKLPTLLRCEIEQAIAGRIAARLRPGDAFGPWHELHFLVLVARTDVAELHQLAQSLRHGIDVRPVVVSRGQMRVSARVQITMADGDPQLWIDHALTGWARRRVAATTSDEPVHAPSNAAELTPSAEPARMRAVLQPDAALCVVEYQPLVLVRGAVADQWQQRLRLRVTAGQPAQVSRNEVVDVARRVGSLATLDRLALRLALDAVASHRARGRKLRLQVEIDLASIIDPGFVTWLESECKSRSTSDASLTVELETDDVIEHLSQVRTVLERLRKLGVHTCLRNFGLQKEALRLLQQVNVDAVKLDTDLALQPSLAFTSLLAHVRDSGVPIEIEDVPDRQTIAKLWDIGADYIQCDLLRAYSPSLDFDFQALV